MKVAFTFFIEEENIESKCFFKPTDGNGYIHFSSCHHKPWLRGIPKGQALRMRRNCSRVENYRTQVEMVGNKLKEKQYEINNVEKAFFEVDGSYGS